MERKHIEIAASEAVRYLEELLDDTDIQVLPRCLTPMRPPRWVEKQLVCPKALYWLPSDSQTVLTFDSNYHVAFNILDRDLSQSQELIFQEFIRPSVREIVSMMEKHEQRHLVFGNLVCDSRHSFMVGKSRCSLRIEYGYDPVDQALRLKLDTLTSSFS